MQIYFLINWFLIVYMLFGILTAITMFWIVNHKNMDDLIPWGDENRDTLLMVRENQIIAMFFLIICIFAWPLLVFHALTGKGK